MPLVHDEWWTSLLAHESCTGFATERRLKQGDLLDLMRMLSQQPRACRERFPCHASYMLYLPHVLCSGQ